MRYLIVGLGNIGQKRRRALGSLCVATVDPYQPTADYTSHLDVPANSYDAVVVATPHRVKLEYVKHFLSLGKHVLVEKPLLLADPQQASDLQALATRVGATWYTSYNHRFEPHVAALKQLLDTAFVGSVYHARLVYGFGTVQNNVGTWRDTGFGVAEEVGCHLVDLASFLLRCEDTEFELHDLESSEAKSYDHCIFSTLDRKVWMECSWTTWKNSFTVDIFGSRGSVHMRGLCKWGPTELITRTRVFPSGVPEETREVVNGPDRTWECDIQEFERRVATGETSCASDLRISQGLQSLFRNVAKPLQARG